MNETLQTPRTPPFAFILAFAVLLALPCAAQQPVDRIVQSANTFLATLSDTQRAKVMYDFHDSAQRARWSNFPTGFVPRGGMSLKQMSAPQRAAALDLMKIVLSSRGYEKVSQIRMADDDFKANGSKHGPRGGGPGPGSGPLRAAALRRLEQVVLPATADQEVGPRVLTARACSAAISTTSPFLANPP